MGILAGKRALIVGVATDRSIAWGIAQAMHAQGAELAFTFGHERLKDRVTPLAESVGSKIVLPLDVTVDAQIDAVFAASREAFALAVLAAGCFALTLLGQRAIRGT